jgi:hypothetical protein
MSGLDSAIRDLEQALEIQQTWRGLVRQRMAGVQEALVTERARAMDPWQAARAGHLHRERKHLMARVHALAADDSSPDAFHTEVRRLLSDLEHHRRRVSDLVYESVSRDLGGSE